MLVDVVMRNLCNINFNEYTGRLLTNWWWFYCYWWCTGEYL